MDYDVNKYGEWFTLLDPKPPVTSAAYGTTFKHYASQKVHAMQWYVMQAQGDVRSARGEGVNNSGRLCYNRIKQPSMLSWIAEVLGAAPDTVRQANAAAASERNFNAKAIAFRKVIPFETILDLTARPGGWLYDPAMRAAIAFGEDGYPDESKSDMHTIFTTMNAEYINKR